MGSSQLNIHDVNDLFEFDNTERSYCAPGRSTRPFAMKISYRSPVLLTHIGMHGDNNPSGFVTNFSLSFTEDGENFTNYIRSTEVWVANISCTCMYSLITIVCRYSLCQVVGGITLHCVLPSPPLV